MWAAIVHRRTQAVVLVLLSSLVAASAVFGPLYARYLEHGLLRDALAHATVTETGITIEQVLSRSSVVDGFAMSEALPPAVAPYFAEPTELTTGRAVVVSSKEQGDEPITTTVLTPAEPCRGIVLVAGTCPTSPDDVLVSAPEAAHQGWSVGDRIAMAPITAAGLEERPAGMRIVGTYTQRLDDTYWFGQRLTGRTGKRVVKGLGSEPLMDSPITVPAFFGAQPERLSVTRTYALLPDRLGVAELPDVVAALESAKARTTAVRVYSAIDEIGAAVVTGQRQAALLVPLLLGQLALLAVVVLGLAAAAAVEQRRPEIAIARLRGRGRRGATALLLGELGTLVALGVPIGFGLAVLAGEAARRLWLPAGVPFDVPGGAWLGAAAALVAGCGAVLLATRPRVREPLPSLLRRVPPRPGRIVVGLVEAVVLTTAAAGVVTIVTGNASGPLAIATPALLALAVGLLLALLVVPLSAALGRAALSRGRAATGLAALHIARRPAVRRVVAIVTIASALVVFATDAYLIAERNRESRATVEAGAEAVLRTDSKDPHVVRAVLEDLDPTGVLATPVAHLGRVSSEAMRTMAVIPNEISRIALPLPGEQLNWSDIAAPPPPPLRIEGRTVSVQVDQVDIPAVNPPGDLATRPVSIPLRLELQQPDGRTASQPLGDLPIRRSSMRLSSTVFCSTACRLAGVTVDRNIHESRAIAGTFRIRSISVDGAPPIDLSRATWAGSGSPVEPGAATPETPGFIAASADPSAAASVRVRFASTRGVLTASTSDPRLPAIVVPHEDTARGEPPVASVAGFVGTDVPVAEVGRSRIAPGGLANVALVDYDALAATAVGLYAPGNIEVWVSDSAATARVSSALQAAGISVTSSVQRDETLRRFDSSASAWALRLALVVGGMALLLSIIVLVLLAATTWRLRSRDLGALRLAGVPPERLRTSLILEHVVVVLVAGLVGAACGAVGSRLAIGLLPLFTTPSATFRADLQPAVPAVSLVTLGSLVLLAGAASLIGVWLWRRSTVERVTEAT
ncbi:MAG TPA: FtsX-like permease family protein [Intrasporangium sp.]|nr:FtsX-like permease family protein [Intrasporangium sp.]